MIDGWHSAAQTMTKESVDAYCRQVADNSLEAVQSAAALLGGGKATGQDKRFVPSAAELAEQARAFDEIIARRDEPAPQLVSYPIGAQPPDGYVALGPIEVDFGSRRIDMRNMSPEEKEAVFENRGLPQAKPGLLPNLKRMGS
jgi:hypothetical protein